MALPIRFLFMLMLAAILLCNSCIKSKTNPGYIAKRSQWHYVRYNEHTVYDSSGRNIIGRSKDTTTGSKYDTMLFVNKDELYFQHLNYFLQKSSDTLRTYEHVIYDSNDPTCEMSYYLPQDSIFITMYYSVHSDNYHIYDGGVEYWWTQK
jgi:hypothetical protein